MKAISTKFLGPTNTLGARIKAFDMDANSVTIGYSHELSGVDVFRAAADAFMAKYGWYLSGRDALVGGAIRGGYVFVIVPERVRLETVQAAR